MNSKMELGLSCGQCIISMSLDLLDLITNRTERMLHEIRIPEVEFRQASIADIISFLNQADKNNAKTDEAKQITIELAPATEKNS